MKLHTILLAAGYSRRLGQAKQGLSWAGISLLERAIAEVRAAQCGDLTVALRTDLDPALYRTLQPHEALLIPDSENRGMGSNLAAAVRQAQRDTEADAYFIVACDQPWIGRTHLREHRRRLEAAPDRILVSDYGESEFGIPVSFPRSFAESLMALEGDKGAKALWSAFRDRVDAVPTPEAAVDIDTEEDWRKFLQQMDLESRGRW